MATRRPGSAGERSDMSGCQSPLVVFEAPKYAEMCRKICVSGFAVTHLEVQSDGEEDQGRRHSHVSSKQQDFFPHILNDHELQHQKTFTAVNHRGELRLYVRIVSA